MLCSTSACPGSTVPAWSLRCAAAPPAVRVVVLPGFADEAPRRRALDLGAHTVLDKDVDPDRLVATLREVCGRAFGPLVLPPPTGLEGLAADELERLWGSLAAAPVATAVVGPDGRFLKVDGALRALVGHPEEALLAAGYQAVVHPEDRDADLEQLQQRCRRVDGEAISVLCNTWLATTRDGRPLRLDGRGRPRYVVRQLIDLREGRRPRTAGLAGDPRRPDRAAQPQPVPGPAGDDPGPPGPRPLAGRRAGGRPGPVQGGGRAHDRRAGHPVRYQLTGGRTSHAVR